MAKKKHNDYGTGIPLHEVEALARVLLPEIQKFFESEEGQREFREWKERQKGLRRPMGSSLRAVGEAGPGGGPVTKGSGPGRSLF